MGSLQKIKELLKFSKKKTYKINMYAEAILDDARVIATDSEEFEIGSAVYVINDAGEVEDLAEGIYTMEDGSKIRIDAESNVAGFGEEEIVEEEVVEEEMEAEEVVAKEEVIEEITADPVVEEVAVKINEATPDEVTEEIAKEVAKVVVDHMAEKVEEEVEVKEVEMSSDVMGEILTRLSAIEDKFNTLEETPSSNGVNITPTHLKRETVDLGKMSVAERVKHLMNN
jgi:hypothetical protein|tara:strand:+ start:650 stop:1330 length:681 start_codon:yes stop_codon:yes gene_type:complete